MISSRKIINDQFGHLMGDLVLKDIGALFLRHTRSGDVIARYGGDEFILLALNPTVEETAAVAERLAAELSQLQWRAGESALQIGVTIGIACSALLPHANVEQLLAAADHDLYAKKSRKKQPLQVADIVLTTAVITEIKAELPTPGAFDARVLADGTPGVPGARRYL